ncbi:MAG: hypothetical protein AB7E96_12110 [Deferribacterales bacterium]
MLIEVFRTGTHTDAGGHVKTWTLPELQQISADYNKSEHEAPVVIGHPVDNAPAYAWVKELQVKNDRLMAEIHDVQPEFKEWVNKKLFKKRSISMYPDGTLRHVGFLGALPPAVKGLKDFNFKEGAEYEQYEYADSNENKEGFMLTLEEMQKQLEAVTGQVSALTKQVNDLTADRDQQKSRAEKAEEELKKVGSELDKTKTEQATADIAQFCDKLVADNRVLPRDRKKVQEFAEGLAKGSSVINFSEGGSEGSPLDKFKELMGSLPQLTDLTLDFSDANPGRQEQPETIKPGQV